MSRGQQIRQNLKQQQNKQSRKVLLAVYWLVVVEAFRPEEVRKQCYRRLFFCFMIRIPSCCYFVSPFLTNEGYYCSRIFLSLFYYYPHSDLESRPFLFSRAFLSSPRSSSPVSCSFLLLDCHPLCWYIKQYQAKALFNPNKIGDRTIV